VPCSARPALLLSLLLLVLTVGANGCTSEPEPSASPTTSCVAEQPAPSGMAPCNPFLAPTAQAATHGNSYRQSTYLASTSKDGRLRAEHLELEGAVPIWAH
jgi:hypothetical protein